MMKDDLTRVESVFPVAALLITAMSLLSGALGSADSVTAPSRDFLAACLLILLLLCLYLMRSCRLHQREILVLKDDLSRLGALQHDAFRDTNFDCLTGLPNRELMLDRLTQAIAGAERHRHVVVLMLVDLAGIRRANETLGHRVGDELVREASRRLARCVREEDSVARLQGDKFLIMLTNLRGSEDATPIAGKIIETIDRPFLVDGHELFISTNLGLSVCPADGADATTLLRNVNAALTSAKRRGANTYHYFTAEMTQRAIERLNIQARLRQAIERGQLVLFYQPVIRLADGAIDGVEVLLRWHDEALGEVAPERFIPPAEDSGLIIPMGRWVLQQACAQAAAWRRRGLTPLRLAINVSSRQFAGNSIVAAVTEALRDSGLEAANLELEITEGLLLVDAPSTRLTLKQLKNLGLRLSLDDFGTGYASISYLRRYAFDTLKIDRSFVHELEHSREAAALVKGITAMAHSLGLKVVAEGVETWGQAGAVRKFGCDFAQGYFYGRPMPATHFGDWLAERPRPAFSRRSESTGKR